MSVSWLAYGAGALLRFLLATSTSFLENRPEISTPLNSWKRLQEGVSLSKLGRCPSGGRILCFAYSCTAYRNKIVYLVPVLWIRIGLSVDPDPGF